MLRLASMLAMLTGCYAPELTDCTVTCSGGDECAGDQVCNSDGRCAGDGVTCQGATLDAPTAMVALRVKVEGTGKVVLAGVGECESRDCTWQVPLAMIRLDAQLIESDKPFEHWTTPNCGGAQAELLSCTITTTGPTTVGAKFR